MLRLFRREIEIVLFSCSKLINWFDLTFSTQNLCCILWRPRVKVQTGKGSDIATWQTNNATNGNFKETTTTEFG